MGESLLEKPRFNYDKDNPVGGVPGISGNSAELGASVIPEAMQRQLVENSEFFQKEGFRRISDLIPELARIQNIKKLKAEIKDNEGIVNYEELNKRLQEKMKIADESSRKEIEELLNKEKYYKDEISIEYVLGSMDALTGHQYVIEENKNFRRLDWQATSHAGTLRHNVLNITKTQTEAKLRHNNTKENSVLLRRLQGDMEYLKAKFQFLEHFNPFIFNYHDAMLVLQTLKKLERQCPDSDTFVISYQRNEPLYKINEETEADSLPGELKEGIREKCMNFEDDSQELIYMTSYTGQIVWEEENIFKKGSNEKYIKSTDLGKFSLTQLKFIYDVFGIYETDENGGKDPVNIKDVIIDPHLFDGKNKRLKNVYPMVDANNVRDDFNLEIPKQILNWYSMETTDENQNRYTAKMMACLLLKAKKDLLKLDPDFVLDGKQGSYNDDNYKVLVDKVNKLAKKIEQWNLDPNIEFEDKEFSQFSTLDLLLAKMVVGYNIQEGWGFGYAGKLASELKYKRAYKTDENGEVVIDKITNEPIKIWIRVQDVGTLHAASDMGDMYHNRRRAAKYKEANRSMGYILLPDSRESRMEYLYEHRADWVLPLSRYTTSPDRIKGEKYDADFDEQMELHFGISEKAREFRKKLGLEIDIDTCLLLRATCHPEETPYLLQGEKDDMENEKKRLAIPDFTPYPLNELDFFDTFSLDDEFVIDTASGSKRKRNKEEFESIAYRMIHDREQKSSFNYHNMEKNQVDYHNVTWDQLSNIIKLYYDVVESREVDELYFASVGLIRTLIKRIDLGLRSNKFHHLQIPEISYDKNNEEYSYVKDSTGKVKMKDVKVPVQVFEMGWVGTLLSNHLAKVYNIVGVGGLNERNINNFVREMAEFDTMVMYLNPEKKTSWDYKNGMRLVIHLFSTLYPRMARISGIQDAKDVTNNYGNLYNVAVESYSKAGKSKKEFEKAKDAYSTYQVADIPFRKAKET
ncbi:MAG: hypothetical protein ABIJ05_04170 [Patescibacteria group bacterium]